VIPLGPEDIKIDRTVGDTERIELGKSVVLEAILAPGHTRDSTCYLVHPDGVLVGGEALGAYVSADEVQPQFTSGFADYIASLKKLRKLDFNFLALPHHGVLSGQDAKNHFATAIRCAEEFRLEVLALLGSGHSPEQITQVLSAKLRHGLAALQPERAFAINLQAMIRVVQREHEGAA
jgi:2-aminobenzoylacetyl-CoA thioesterase